MCLPDRRQRKRLKRLCVLLVKPVLFVVFFSTILLHCSVASKNTLKGAAKVYARVVDWNRHQTKRSKVYARVTNLATDIYTRLVKRETPGPWNISMSGDNDFDGGMNKIHFYGIMVTTKTATWQVSREFDAFTDLRHALDAAPENAPFPGRDRFGRRDVPVAEKRKALELWLQSVSQTPDVFGADAVNRFLIRDTFPWMKTELAGDMVKIASQEYFNISFPRGRIRHVLRTYSDFALLKNGLGAMKGVTFPPKPSNFFGADLSNIGHKLESWLNEVLALNAKDGRWTPLFNEFFSLLPFEHFSITFHGDMDVPIDTPVCSGNQVGSGRGSPLCFGHIVGNAESHHYNIHVNRSDGKPGWQVFHRYNHFDDLRLLLGNKADALPGAPFPTASFIPGAADDPAQRRPKLEKWLQEVLKHPDLYGPWAGHVGNFLGFNVSRKVVEIDKRPWKQMDVAKSGCGKDTVLTSLSGLTVEECKLACLRSDYPFIAFGSYSNARGGDGTVCQLQSCNGVEEPFNGCILERPSEEEEEEEEEEEAHEPPDRDTLVLFLASSIMGAFCLYAIWTWRGDLRHKMGIVSVVLVAVFSCAGFILHRRASQGTQPDVLQQGVSLYVTQFVILWILAFLDS